MLAKAHDALAAPFSSHPHLVCLRQVWTQMVLQDVVVASQSDRVYCILWSLVHFTISEACH